MIETGSKGSAALRATETEYRGFRFRSRTEARYAVFFDAADIAWQYEVEGFHLNGTRYLPDFFLPGLKTYIEVKPTKESALQAAPLLLALKEASGCAGLFAVGSPSVAPPTILFGCGRDFKGRAYLYEAATPQCPFCGRIELLGHDGHYCCCSGDAQILERPPHRFPRLLHALGEAQRARFEFGETGKPRPYASQPARAARVYVAGAIFCADEAGEKPYDEDGGQVFCPPELDPWRTKLFNCRDEDLGNTPGPSLGRYVYAGPTITYDHGYADEGLARDCLAEVDSADVLFVWLDRVGTIGTLVEVGAAYAKGKPTFVAFANESLATHFYFVRGLATVAVATDVGPAWNSFTRWWANQ